MVYIKWMKNDHYFHSCQNYKYFYNGKLKILKNIVSHPEMHFNK